MRRRVALVCLAVAAVVAAAGCDPAGWNGPTVHPVPAGGVFVVDGHGWGHGVGMSQWGAQGAASRGVPAATILSTYYPGTSRGTVGNDVLRIWLQRDDGTDLTVEAAEGLTVTDLSTGRATPLPAGSAALARGAGGHGDARRRAVRDDLDRPGRLPPDRRAAAVRHAGRARRRPLPGRHRAPVPRDRPGDAGFRGVQERRQRAAGGLRQRGRPAGGQPQLGARGAAGAGGRGAHVRGLVPLQPSTRQLLGRLRQRKLPGLRRRRRGTARDHGRGPGHRRLDPHLRRGPGRHHVQRLQRRLDGCRRRALPARPRRRLGRVGREPPAQLVGDAARCRHRARLSCGRATAAAAGQRARRRRAVGRSGQDGRAGRGGRPGRAYLGHHAPARRSTTCARGPRTPTGSARAWWNIR